MPGGKKVVRGGSSGAAPTTVAVPSGVRRLETSEGASAQRDDEPEEEGEEDLRDGGIPFFINRGGLPVDEATWERMWKHVAKIHPDGEKVAQRIRGATDLPKADGPGQGNDQRGSANQMPGSRDPGNLPHQQHAHPGTLPHQLQDLLLRELLPPHRAGGELRGPLRGAGHEPARGPDVQAAGLPHAQRARAGLRGRLRPLLARAEEGEVGPVRVPRPAQRGADRVEALCPGRGEAGPRRLPQGAGAPCPRHAAQDWQRDRPSLPHQGPEEGCVLPTAGPVQPPPQEQPQRKAAFRREEAFGAQSHARPQWVPDPGVRQVAEPQPRPLLGARICLREPASRLGKLGLMLGPGEGSGKSMSQLGHPRCCPSCWAKPPNFGPKGS
ncbi:tubulinyl-Tyr carboxypeptidase 1 isoform X1 [Hippopotamus amphibius kiboko]|uniref:tubulinyl-Tyr carboxypeptidase 1 isoform X1 n=1 Tax=Hippopotamus amphibius kiboko TaxID=575201 RepID=UPI0025976DD6|nr:tubulinyl-Tyr carboxypeptidase 1 isoform X1 [Hippopotamus amphibius kiboko]